MLPGQPQTAPPRARYKRSLLGGLALANAGVIALAALLSWFSYQQSLRHIDEVADAFALNFAHLLEARVERIRSYEELLATEMERELAHPGQPSTVQELIASLDPESYHNFSARVIDENGAPIYSRDLPRIKESNWSERDYFQQLRAHPGLPIIMTAPVWGKFTQEPTIVFAKAYRKPDKSFAGVIVMEVTLKSLRELQRPSSGGIDDAFAIRDTRDMRLLSRSPASALDEAAIGSSAAPDQFDPGRPPYLGLLPAMERDLLLSGARSGRYATDQAADKIQRSVSMVAIANAPLAVFAGVGRGLSRYGNLPLQLGAAAAFCMIFLLGSAVFVRQLLAQDARRRSSEAALAGLNASLETQVAARTSDLQEAMDHVRRSGAELAAFERLAALGDMAAGVAHELNTPIGNALLASSTLCEEAQALHDALRPDAGPPSRSRLSHCALRIKELAQAQATAAARSAELIRAFKQVAVDQASLRRRRFDLREAIAAVAASLRPSMARTGVAVDVDLRIPEGIECDSYPGALGQIAANLLLNATKHGFAGRERGAIRIRGGLEPDDSGQPSAWVEFSDDGGGIPEQDLPKIFDPYFTTAADQGGSGIGLSMSRKLAENALGGSLAASPAGAQQGGLVGAIFKLSFPLAAPVRSCQPDVSNPFAHVLGCAPPRDEAA